MAIWALDPRRPEVSGRCDEARPLFAGMEGMQADVVPIPRN